MSIGGAVGGIGGGDGGGGGLGAAASIGPMAFSPAPAPAQSPEPAAPAPRSTAAMTSTWFDSSGVMDTQGAREGTTVTLADNHLRAGVGTIDPDKKYPLPMVGSSGANQNQGVHQQVASVYAANRMQ